MTSFSRALTVFTRGFGSSNPPPEPETVLTGPPPGAPAFTIRRHPRDREFLPAALEIIEAPPSPIRTALLFAICLLFAVSLVWAYFGRIDVVSVAVGKVQPRGQVKTIQSVETARVNMIAVSNGVHVKAGSVLFTLDPAETEAEQAEYARNVAGFRGEALRRGAAVQAARTDTTPKIDWPATIPADIANREQSVLESDLRELRADVQNLKAQVAEKSAQRERLEQTIAAQSALVATLKERVDMRTTLMTSGSGPRSAVLDAQENYQTQAANLAYQSGQRMEIEAGLAVAQTAIEKSIAEFIARNDGKRAEADRQADDYLQKLDKARVKSTHMVVVSPVDGIVQGSTVTTEGQVVNTGEELMRIVPDSRSLEIEAYLPNKDVGFVEPGQVAVIKVESFPFTRYGTLTGKVIRVARDAIATPDAEQSSIAPAKSLNDRGLAGAQKMRDLVFPMTIELEDDTINADGRNVPLSPGMAVTAEVKTGSRRMINYVLSPIMEVTSTAMRER